MNDPMSAPWDGRPANPEKDGWHWLLGNTVKKPTPEAACWQAPRARYPGFWFFQGVEEPYRAERMGPSSGWLGYLGPCLTPAEITACEQAAWLAGAEAMREAAARDIDCACPSRAAILRDGHKSCPHSVNCAARNAEAIRAIPLPTPPDGGPHE